MGSSTSPKDIKVDVPKDQAPQNKLRSHFIKREWPFFAALVVFYFILGPSQSPISSTLQSWRSPSQNTEMDRWIDVEKRVALERILRNIGPVVGAKDGLVVASPSQGETDDIPDYYYTWTRDSAMTISSLLPIMLFPNYTSSATPPLSERKAQPTASKTSPEDPGAIGVLLEPLVRAYISSQSDLQLLDTPSGNLRNGGLNEPKYRVDGSVFTGPWGRPQRTRLHMLDGPALRALSLIAYANYLLDRGYLADIDYLRSHLYDSHQIRAPGKVIKNDLEEVAGSWWEAGFDLWEEVNGHHLFTRLVSLRALQAGSQLANRLGDPSAADWYSAMADKIQQSLATFWTYDSGDVEVGHWLASTFGQEQVDAATRRQAEKRNVPSHLTSHKSSSESISAPWAVSDGSGDAEGGASEEVSQNGHSRRGLDCAFPLCVIHTGTLYPQSDLSWMSFEPSHPGVLSTLHRYILTFDGLYGINEGRKWTEGWALGRYAEDLYDGVGQSLAHPWFICTFSVAHVFYLAYTSFARQGRIEVTEHTLGFWSDVLAVDPTHLSINETWTGSLKSHREPRIWKMGIGWTTESRSEKRYRQALGALMRIAEAYMDIGRRYSDMEGRMSEQIDRTSHDGSPKGARDLTWSYASFLEVSRARDLARSL